MSTHDDSSSDSADDVCSGFTSDSYADDDSVVAELTWPTWSLFTSSLGLSAVQWSGPLGVLRIKSLFGVIMLHPLHVNVAIVGMTQFDIQYQDLVDSPTPIQVNREGENIRFFGTVGQYRSFRRRLQKLIFDQLVPMTSKVSYEAESVIAEFAEADSKESTEKSE